MANDQKPRCSSNIVTTLSFLSLNILLFHLHTPKLKNIIILAITFSPLISKFFQLATWNFFGLISQLKSFWRQAETMCQLQLLLLGILLLTVLVLHNVIQLEYLMPISHGVNKKPPTIVSPPPPNQIFTRFVAIQVIIYQPSFDLI